MKTILEYINNDSLSNHIHIDYAIYENAGLYNGVEELSHFLTNKIRSHQDKEFVIEYNSDDKQLSKMHNIFFNKIILDCVRDKNNRNEGEYIINNKVDYNVNTKQFNFIVIKLSLSLKHNDTEVYQRLLHELTHAWDNYNSFKKGTTSLKHAVLDSNYKNILKAFDDETNYKHTIGQILYFTSDIELNGFMAEFAGYLYDYIDNNTIDDPHTAVKIVKQSELYKNYKNIGVWVTALYNDDKRIPNKFKTLLYNEYNKINKTDYTEYKISKILYNKYVKINNKIESNMGKLCSRYVKELTIK